MSPPRKSFRLHILGHLENRTRKQTLLTLAEFQESRVVARVEFLRRRINDLVANIRHLRGFIEAGSPEFNKPALIELGSDLFDLVIQGDVRRLLDRATGTNDEIVPCEIFVEDYQIASWPWEFLFDHSGQKFLCQERRPVSRGIFSLSSRPQLKPKKGRVHILLLIGVLPDDPHTSPEEEVQWINNVFRTELANNAVEIDILQGTGPLELHNKLKEREYDILHFFGHAGFDAATREGYLRFDQDGEEPYRFSADEFSQLTEGKGIRLVFLNACETGRLDEEQHPARGSLAGALLNRGIPAVVATQFSIPDVSAHYLSSMIYNVMLSGKPLVEALTDGRLAMSFAKRVQFCDWGIPVLYASDLDTAIFPRNSARKQDWVPRFQTAINAKNLIKGLASGAGSRDPSVTFRTDTIRKSSKPTEARVALVDIDAKAGFLPELIDAANRKQNYFRFQVSYIPIPAGTIRRDRDKEAEGPQMFLPRLEEYLHNAPADLGVDYVCCLTRCMVAGVSEKGEPFSGYFAHRLISNKKVAVVSTYDLRTYAADASLPFAKAVLCLCLSMLIHMDKRWNLGFHEETVGCFMDLCWERDDILVGLRKMRFDHRDCRDKIKDREQLAALDALLEL